ncbi:MAG: GntR family transcriptional regulator [Spirochaetaceae bacterium]|jgi:DNA-binding GntR family transcriptional regulator|nr:GntR family transcriptional regulator [Spirochaetaceae bacterium]
MSGIKSRVICDDLLRRITSGDLSGALMLPAEGKLAESYACSRPTVRKALAGLRPYCNASRKVFLQFIFFA